jgi:hypothetical protein
MATKSSIGAECGRVARSIALDTAMNTRSEQVQLGSDSV